MAGAEVDSKNFARNTYPVNGNRHVRKIDRRERPVIWMDN